ncbi:MAG TPA: RNA polymerase subunit sigma-70 [Lachnospiraceae bacterium]|jgi:RNA polymerase sigma-70 factor (ECF subfamily)|nr:RNA polymerase subunit sigma-70 [Lachnospiraceae bacterium]HBY72895.1 RNA polymerase subunit sigma-70 [Lachnospiraceae bacterium]HCA70892.1 RNA polymerase subunit sigma-70 [Lachnospiraceae bacterium]HCM14235.1 RNA polymerase subunit sigma-70 [Lachnospiraceae bacterium]HCR40837.1 RNA polymerase subunit sigma-70 [Lachnospiraceae bacterium]
MAYRSFRPEDFEVFVTKHENRLYRTALAITGNVADAEDMVQEAFLRAYEKAPEFESEEHEKAWLIRVTVNLCNSCLRSPWRKRTTPLLDSYPAAQSKQQELVEQIMTLPSKYRTVIHLFYYEGYSIKDISMLTGQKEATVRSHLTRARQKLKLILKEDDYESV